MLFLTKSFTATICNTLRGIEFPKRNPGNILVFFFIILFIFLLLLYIITKAIFTFIYLFKKYIH